MNDLELTKLLAEKVMRWEPDGPAAIGSYKAWDASHTAYMSKFIGFGWGDWNPLGRIDHAWEVLEAVLKLSPSRTALLFLSELSEPEDWFQPAKEAARAICAAALKAVGVEA